MAQESVKSADGEAEYGAFVTFETLQERVRSIPDLSGKAKIFQTFEEALESYGLTREDSYGSGGTATVYAKGDSFVKKTFAGAIDDPTTLDWVEHILGSTVDGIDVSTQHNVFGREAGVCIDGDEVFVLCEMPFLKLPNMMEFVQSQVSETRPRFTVSELNELLSGMIFNVMHVHQQGFVYRDLKPANMLVGRAADGGLKVYLVDFNGAGQKGSSGEGKELTCAYCAPEVLKNLEGMLEFKHDIWSCGIIGVQLIHVDGGLPWPEFMMNASDSDIELIRCNEGSQQLLQCIQRYYAATGDQLVFQEHIKNDPAYQPLMAWLQGFLRADPKLRYTDSQACAAAPEGVRKCWEAMLQESTDPREQKTLRTMLNWANAAKNTPSKPMVVAKTAPVSITPSTLSAPQATLAPPTPPVAIPQCSKPTASPTLVLSPQISPLKNSLAAVAEAAIAAVAEEVNMQVHGGKEQASSPQGAMDNSTGGPAQGTAVQQGAAARSSGLMPLSLAETFSQIALQTGSSADQVSKAQGVEDDSITALQATITQYAADDDKTLVAPATATCSSRPLTGTLAPVQLAASPNPSEGHDTLASTTLEEMRLSGSSGNSQASSSHKIEDDHTATAGQASAMQLEMAADRPTLVAYGEMLAGSCGIDQVHSSQNTGDDDSIAAASLTAEATQGAALQMFGSFLSEEPPASQLSGSSTQHSESGLQGAEAEPPQPRTSTSGPGHAAIAMNSNPMPRDPSNKQQQFAAKLGLLCDQIAVSTRPRPTSQLGIAQPAVSTQKDLHVWASVIRGDNLRKQGNSGVVGFLRHWMG